MFRAEFTKEITPAEVDALVSKCVDPSKTIISKLVTPNKIRKPAAYKRFQNLEAKTQFRTDLLNALYQRWSEKGGEAYAQLLRAQFLELVEQAAVNGAVILADLINRSRFASLVSEYDGLLEQHGNNSWLHSYVNLANHPKFLTNPNFNHAFLHPLLVAVISYQVGGPIRIVDARAKNAEPMSVKAQDNMLHIDNTPFNEEFKVIVTWQRGQASGPKGQYFVFIPGTHQGARQCMVDAEGRAWSTENGSIFVTPDTVQNVFDVQTQMTNAKQPVVVEVKHDSKPLTTLFAAGALVHHRYRTEEGLARSCMILAFHRAGDNPGQFMAPEFVETFSEPGDLIRYLFGYQGHDTVEGFIAALASEAQAVGAKLGELNDDSNSSEIVAQTSRELSGARQEKWKQTVTSAPTVEEKKIQSLHFPLGEKLSRSDFMTFVGSRMMMFDKHGPLDLILYEDAHEEIRKWARNRIREMPLALLQCRLTDWVRLYVLYLMNKFFYLKN